MSASILLIDDSRDIHTLVNVALLDTGYNLHYAECAEAGFRIARDVSVDLILLDVGLPDMNGFDLYEELKANEKTRSIGIVYLTSAGSREERIRGLKQGPIDYIVKPFDSEELALRVVNALRVTRLSRALERNSTLQMDYQNSAFDRRPMPHLKLPQVIEARMNNPWSRVAPAHSSSMG